MSESNIKKVWDEMKDDVSCFTHHHGPKKEKEKGPDLFLAVPSKKDTGVEPIITRICAQACNYLYSVSQSKNPDDPNSAVYGLNDFFKQPFEDENKVEHKVEVFILDTHGKFETTNPPFMAAITGTTMILGWRGSTTTMDWMSDLDESPVVSSRWADQAEGVRVFGSYLSLVDSDLTIHGKKLVDRIKQGGIDEVIFTGHSLGGGLAQVAHLFVEGCRSQDNDFPWSTLSKDFSIRTLAFEAPTTTLLDLGEDEEKNNSSKAFLEKFKDNVVCTVFSSDVVPRVPHDMKYIHDAAINAVDNMCGGTIMHGVCACLIKWKGTQIMKKFASEEATFETLTKVLCHFRHIGKIVYYESAAAEPASKTFDELLAMPYQAAAGDDNDIFLDFDHNHMFIVEGPGLAFESFKIIPPFNFAMKKKE